MAICENCGGTSFRKLPYYYELEGTRIDGVRCRECGLVTVSPMPPDDALIRMYGAEYFESDYHCGHTGEVFGDDEFSPEHRRLLDRLVSLRPGGRLLEVGAAAGGFLAHARDAGYEVAGVEPSRAACDAAQLRGMELHCGDLESAAFPDGSFDAVYMGDVLEHMPRPAAALRETNRITGPGGLIAVLCPINIGLISSRVGLFAYRVTGRTRRSPIPPYHLYEFTAGTLAALIRRSGYDIIEASATIHPPWKVNLRGSAAERLTKLLLHWPNYILTKITGLMGDRVMIIGRKRG